MVMTKPAISVLTPTYNRAHVLHRAYESLQRQTVRDFEWVVVDDGSTDETPVLLARWQTEANFPITWYRYLNNRGRNAAVNTGRTLVSGDYTLILDSDDALLDDALQTVRYWRDKTGIDEIPSVYALMFRCVDENENLVGRLPNDEEGRLPQEVMRISGREARYRLRMTFEFIGIAKTPTIRQREFTELTKGEHGPLTITHNHISSLYETIYVDHPIRCYYRSDGEVRLSSRATRRSVKWPRGNYLRSLAILNNDIRYLRDNPKVFLNAARKVTRLGLHIGRSPRNQYRDLAHARARMLWIAAMPAGMVAYIRDRLRGRRAPAADPDISRWGPASRPEKPALYPAPERLRSTMTPAATAPEPAQ